ncbi:MULTISPECIES: hypothetical protein [unclassified Nostoc]|nr:hypothetical protein [Nostoc sp. DedQUE02]
MLSTTTLRNTFFGTFYLDGSLTINVGLRSSLTEDVREQGFNIFTDKLI